MPDDWIVGTHLPQVGLLALIALHQLSGPVLFRAALARAGEIGRMDEQGMEATADASPLRSPL